MQAYRFDEAQNRRTVATRRLTRRALAKLEPWAEEQDSGGTEDEQRSIVLDGNPSAEEEAEAFSAQEQYWEDISYDPFAHSTSDPDDAAVDDASEF